MSLTDLLLSEMWGEVTRHLSFADRQAFRSVSRAAVHIVRRHPLTLADAVATGRKCLLLEEVSVQAEPRRWNTAREFLAVYRRGKSTPTYTQEAMRELMRKQFGGASGCEPASFRVRFEARSHNGPLLCIDHYVNVKSGLCFHADVFCALMTNGRYLTSRFYVNSCVAEFIARMPDLGAEFTVKSNSGLSLFGQKSGTMLAEIAAKTSVFRSDSDPEPGAYGNTYQREETFGALLLKYSKTCLGEQVPRFGALRSGKALEAVYVWAIQVEKSGRADLAARAADIAADVRAAWPLATPDAPGI